MVEFIFPGDAVGTQKGLAERMAEAVNPEPRVLQTRWCTFTEDLGFKGATTRWLVTGSAGPTDRIGTIRWNGGWRQYVFESRLASYNRECLNDIAQFLLDEMTAWAKGRAEQGLIQ